MQFWSIIIFENLGYFFQDSLINKKLKKLFKI